MRLSTVLALLTIMGGSVQAQQDPQRALEREILARLIEVNTSDSARQTPRIAAMIRQRLLEAGFPAADVHIVGHAPDLQNVVARYRGRSTGKKPIMLMAHLDVVDARREDWSFPPYEFREDDGFYYGRGTTDNKAGVATLIANFIRMRQEKFVPDRDLIMVLTADEETDGDAIAWLLSDQRGLVDAEYALNTDAGGGALVDGKATAFAVQTAEKVYVTYELTVRNKGGHSSVPVADNAIYRLSAGLSRLGAHTFPVRLNETTRAYFERSARTESGDTRADMQAVATNADPAAAARLSEAVPFYNSVMRTTCVATRLYAGHADNALPQLARATVNCRLVPDDHQDSVRLELGRIVADSAIEIRIADPAKPSPPSPLRPDLMVPIENLVKEMWPDATVVPEMSTGATDGLFARNAGIPVYGVSAIFEDINDSRAHGRDERVGVEAFHRASAFWYRLLKALTSSGGST